MIMNATIKMKSEREIGYQAVLHWCLHLGRHFFFFFFFAFHSSQIVAGIYINYKSRGKRLGERADLISTLVLFFLVGKKISHYYVGD